MITAEDFKNMEKFKADYLDLNKKIADRAFQIIKMIVQFSTGRDQSSNGGVEYEYTFYFSDSHHGGIGDFFDSCVGDSFNYHFGLQVSIEDPYWRYLRNDVRNSYDQNYLESMPIAFLTMPDKEILQVLQIQKDKIIEKQKIEKEKKIEKKKKISLLRELALSKLTKEEKQALRIK